MQLQTILINYKTPEMTLKSLAAFMREMGDRPGVHVTLVDNASGDGSVEACLLYTSPSPRDS